MERSLPPISGLPRGTMPGPDDVAAALDAWPWREHPALPGRHNRHRAGVLVPLCWTEGRLVTVLTLRSAHLRQHAGEVSWPGGKPEPGDADISATALREAREEVGVRDARLLGRLSSIPVYTSEHRLEPFVAEVDWRQLRADGHEVARLLPLDVGELLSAPAVQAVSYELGGARRQSPVWERPGGEVVYGGTAHVLLELLHLLAPLLGNVVPPLREGRLGWSDLLPEYPQP